MSDDLYAHISVGAVRAATDAVRKFLDDRDRMGRTFSPSEVVGIVLDMVRAHERDNATLNALAFPLPEEHP